MKRIVLTGGSGFAGNNLARRLVRDGHEVHLLLRAGFQSWRLYDLENDVAKHEANLEDAEGLTRLLGAIRPDWVFHLAVYGAYPGQSDFGNMLDTNLHGTVNLVTSALECGFEAFVNAGTSSEYGYKAVAPTETTFLEPNSHYAVSKAAATQYCAYIARHKNVPISTLRLYSAYGPFEEPSRFVPTLVLKGLEGQLPPLVDPATARDFIYIDDVVDAFLAAAEASRRACGQIYNVGTGRQTTIGQAVEVARGALHLTEKPVWNTMPRRQWDTGAWQADIGSITRDLAWRPRFDFASGFAATIQWFQDHPELADRYRRMQSRAG